MEGMIHIAKQMDELRKEGHYDVVISVGEKQFPCHRHFVSAACPALKPILLKENWQNEKPILNDIDPELFEIMFTYMYSGTLGITAENGFNLLKLADYLLMDPVIKLCISFLNVSCPLNDLLKAFEFADHIKNFDFKCAIASKIMRNLDKFCVDKSLLPLSFENFELILKKGKQMIDTEGDLFWRCCNNSFSITVRRTLTCTVCKKSLVNGAKYSHKSCICGVVLEWICYDTRRIIHFGVLSNYTNLTSSHIRDFTKLFQCYRNDLMKRFEEGASSRKTQVFVHILKLDQIKTLAFFKIDGNEEWLLSSNFTCFASNLKTVNKNRTVFYLSYNDTEFENKFWIENEKKMELLRPPPTVVSTYKLASAKDVIYLYDFTDKCWSLNVSKRAKIETTNMYCYIEGSDEWFLKPHSPKQLYHSYFISLKNSLYLIGGTSEYESTYPSEKFIQRYDPRAAKWDVISADFEVDLLLNGAACAYENKIYIYSKPEHEDDNVDDERYNLKFYTYDICANKWQVEDIILEKQFEPTALIPFGNQLWAFSRNPKHGYIIYDVDNNVWSERKTLIGEFENVEDYAIVDANVF